MKILVVGTGYVGLVSGACFAEMGNHVTCLDIDEKKIQMLQDGKIPFYEPGLEELVRRNKKRLHFTADYAQGVQNSTVIFLALPTPPKSDGSTNLSYLLDACKKIATHMQEYRLIANKSTAPVGTGAQIKQTIEAIASCEFDVASNPEFLKEGAAVQDCLRPDRIIIGTENQRAASLLRKIYSGFTMSRDRIIEMDIRSAELTKYAANAMLACRISFMNELSALCETYAVDIHQIRKGIGSDSRIGHQFLYAGMGFGGSCFPKDLRSLIDMAEKKKISIPLLNSIVEVNEGQKQKLGQKVIEHFKGNLQGKTIAIWGLTFKPNTDDMREAPSLTLIDMLLEQGARLKLFDPIGMDNAREILKPSSKIVFCESEQDAAHDADAICLVTEWKQFRFIDLAETRKMMRGNGFFDGRNQYQKDEMQKIGFAYYGMGVQSSKVGLLEELLDAKPLQKL